MLIVVVNVKCVQLMVLLALQLKHNSNYCKLQFVTSCTICILSFNKLFIYKLLGIIQKESNVINRIYGLKVEA